MIHTCGKCVEGYIRGATAEDGAECGCDIYICDDCTETVEPDEYNGDKDFGFCYDCEDEQNN